MFGLVVGQYVQTHAQYGQRLQCMLRVVGMTQRLAGSGRQGLASMHEAERGPGASGLTLARRGGAGMILLSRH